MNEIRGQPASSVKGQILSIFSFAGSALGHSLLTPGLEVV